MGTEGNWVSPNEMFEAAKEMMIDGRDPNTDEDWVLIVNFVAVNTAPGLENAVTGLMMTLLDCPLKSHTIEYIVANQIYSKGPPEKDRHWFVINDDKGGELKGRILKLAHSFEEAIEWMKENWDRLKGDVDLITRTPDGNQHYSSWVVD